MYSLAQTSDVTPHAALLKETARALVVAGKGILAADESIGTIGKRFSAIGIENTEANRAAYRDLLFTAPNLSASISGVILFEETLFGTTAAGKKIIEPLVSAGILLGIKVDKGVAPLPGGHADETYTTGLDGLYERCVKYFAAGARFAKWRAVLKIDAALGLPSQRSIAENAYGLAQYGATCQAAGLVPIIEPEVLSDGKHSAETCAIVTERVLAATYDALRAAGVLLEGTLLKPNMVTPGTDAPACADAKEKVWADAYLTVRTLSRTVPPAVPGIVFLSGGQSEEDATLHLNAMNAQKKKNPINP